MKARGAALALFLVSCTRPNPALEAKSAGEICQAPQSCGRGLYELCVHGDQCRFLTSDGLSFACTSCGACTSAQLDVTSWCLGPTAPTTTTTGGTTSVTGGTTSSSSSGGTTASATDMCNSCSTDAQSVTCGAQTDSCDVDCSDLVNCVGACASGDLACQQTCYDAATPAAQAAANQVLDCLCGQCFDVCAGTCAGRVRSGGTTSSTGSTTSATGSTTSSTGGTTGATGSTTSSTGGTTGATSCRSCEDTVTTPSGACASPMATCQNNLACATMWSCMHACTTGACQDQCGASASSATINLYNDVGNCVCSSCSVCASEC